jgi:predicted DNA-binding transcriptional regulator AlpA
MSETCAQQEAFGWAAAAVGEPNVELRATPEATPPTLPMPSNDARVERQLRASRSPRASMPKEPLPPDDELWDVHATARFLRRSVSWVYHRAEDGTLPVKRIGGWGLRFIPGEVRAWVEASGAPRRRLGKGTKE